MTNLSIPAKCPKTLKAAAILAAAAALAALLLATAIPGALAQQDKPAAPSGFSVASGGEGEVVASWDAHDGANLKDYRLQWREDGGEFKKLTDMSVNALTTSTSHTVTGLTAGTTYDFRLRARFTVGKQSHWTQTISVQAGAADAQDQGGSQGSDQQRSNHIETPQNLSVEYLSYTSFEVSWDSPTATDITHVRVRRTRPGQSDESFEIVEDGIVTFINTAPNQNFTVGIRFGTSATDFGPEATVGVSMVALPTVNGLTMKSVEYDFVNFEWYAPSDTNLKQFRVVRKTKTPGQEPDRVERLTVTNTFEHADTNPTPDTTYVYEISHFVEDSGGGFHYGPVSRIEAAVPDTLTISVSDATGTEGGNLVFNISLNRTSTRPVTFVIRTRDGTGPHKATSQFDYQTFSLTETIPAGGLSTTFEVATKDGSIYERYDETFRAEIDEATLVNVEPGQTVAQGTIVDDDPEPAVDFQSAQRRVAEAAGTLNNALCLDVVGLNVGAPAEYGFDVSLTVSGNATNGEDFTEIDTTWLISPLQTDLCHPLILVNDNVFEDHEEATFTLLPGPHYSLGSETSYQITIDDDDKAPQLVVTTLPGTEGGQNQGSTGTDLSHAIFKLKLVGNDFEPDISGDIEYIDGSAKEGEDFHEGPSVFVFGGDAPNPQYIQVPIIDDDVFDGPDREHFQVRFHNESLIRSAQGEIITSEYEYVTNYIIDNDDPPEGVDYIGSNVGTTGRIAVDQSWINGNPVKGRIEHLDDFDWYKTELEAERCYQVDIWGKTMSDEGHTSGLTLEDPELYGVYDSKGRYLYHTYNADGRGDNRTPRHTMWFTKGGTFYIAVSHEWNRYEGGGTFELSLIDMKVDGPDNQHCTKVEVD